MSKKILEGLIKTNAKGRGFFVKEDGKFVNIDFDDLGTALDRDYVQIEIGDKKNKWGEETGKVLKIIERNKDVFVGRIEFEKDKKTKIKKVKFIPDNRRFYPEVQIINIDDFKDLKDRKILLKLERWKDARSKPIVSIQKVLGKIGENETEMAAAVYDRGLVMGFPKEVEEAAQKLKKRAKELIDNDRLNRRDLRDLDVFTIDPADAKDFDDALSARKLENGNYEIGVHIADPSFFVRPDDVIDKEAKRRGTSIYLVDRTIPMLPEVLSNDLCSLNPNEEKMTFSALFEMNEEGEVLNEWFGSAIVISKKRYDYLEAQETLDKNEGPMLEDLKILSKIAQKLKEKRYKAGSIYFNSTEVRFKLDENKFPIEVYVKPHTWTMELIEEFMLLDNQRVSMRASLKEDGTANKNPFIYRTHDRPKREKIQELLKFLGKIGYYPDLDENGELSTFEINQAMKEHKDKPEAGVISLSILRSMEKAKYTTSATGHFGLGFLYYSHFTSPIRRYPDFIAHRYLRYYLENKVVPGKLLKTLEADARHSSEMEVKAVDAERASIAFKYAQYYSVRIGEDFNGIITGVQRFGIFVEEENTKAQGMIPVEQLGEDFWIFEDENMILKGEFSGKKFALGDKIKTKVKKVNLNEKIIDLELTNPIELSEEDKELVREKVDNQRNNSRRERFDLKNTKFRRRDSEKHSHNSHKKRR